MIYNNLKLTNLIDQANRIRFVTSDKILKDIIIEAGYGD